MNRSDIHRARGIPTARIHNQTSIRNSTVRSQGLVYLGSGLMNPIDLKPKTVYDYLRAINPRPETL